MGVEEEKDFDLNGYISAEKEDILGEKNMYYTAKKLGRTPTEDEAAHHFVSNGGAEDFERRRKQDFVRN